MQTSRHFTREGQDPFLDLQNAGFRGVRNAIDHLLEIEPVAPRRGIAMTWHQESIVPDFGLTLESEVSLVNRPNLLFGGLSDRDAILCHEFMFCGRDALSLATQFHLTVEEVQQQVTHFVGRIDSLGHWCE